MKPILQPIVNVFCSLGGEIRFRLAVAGASPEILVGWNLGIGVIVQRSDSWYDSGKEGRGRDLPPRGDYKIVLFVWNHHATKDTKRVAH